MNQAWVLLWLSSQPATAEQEAQLRAWAERQGYILSVPRESASAQPYAGATVTHIESLLERARLAADGLEREQALELVQQAENELFAHPEVPQAAWLLAEALHLQAELWEAAGHGAQADEARRARAALEGARSPSSSTSVPLGKAPDASALSESEWLVKGLRPGDELFWNGVLVQGSDTALRVRAAAGRHHARVLRSGGSPWAGWVELSSETPEVALDVPPPAPCSVGDLEPMRSGTKGAPVACNRWIAARPSAGGVELARCHQNRCGAFERWPRAVVPPAALAPSTPDEEPTPWLSYGLLGTAVAATATILILSFTQRDTRERPVWVYGGIE
jgi:hypothetical protein